MPVFYGQLACDERGPSVVTVFDDFQQVSLLFCCQSREAEVIEDEKLRL
jgi:uncharacterized membrane protein